MGRARSRARPSTAHRQGEGAGSCQQVGLAGRGHGEQLGRGALGTEGWVVLSQGCMGGGTGSGLAEPGRRWGAQRVRTLVGQGGHCQGR